MQEEKIVMVMNDKNPVDNRLDGVSDNNYVIASGVIVNRFDAKNAVLLTLMTRGGRKLDKRNYPQFVLTGELREAAEGLRVKDHVQIKGVISSRKNPKTGEYLPVINATSIERTKSRLAELTNEQELGRVRGLPTADFYVVGTITKFEAYGKGVVHLVIKSILPDGKITYGSYYYFNNDLSGIINDLKVGNRICAMGEIQTEKKEIEGEKPRYIQTNVILDISSVENILTLKR